MDIEMKIDGGVVVGCLSDYVEAGANAPADTTEKSKRQRKSKDIAVEE